MTSRRIGHGKRCNLQAGNLLGGDLGAVKYVLSIAALKSVRGLIGNPSDLWRILWTPHRNAKSLAFSSIATHSFTRYTLLSRPRKNRGLRRLTERQACFFGTKRSLVRIQSPRLLKAH
jgi:hypothetical protein